VNRRTSIKNILAVSFLGTSLCSSCINNNNGQIESLLRYKSLIAELVDVIIPATDTPGAKDAKVEGFIIKTLAEQDAIAQNRFLSGLKDLQDYSKRTYGEIFQNCSLSTKESILEHYENKGFTSRILKKIDERLFGEPFFYTLKTLTVIGFCTSKIGITQALVYDFIPVYYQACIPLKEGQKSWATN